MFKFKNLQFNKFLITIFNGSAFLTYLLNLNNYLKKKNFFKISYFIFFTIIINLMINKFNVLSNYVIMADYIKPDVTNTEAIFIPFKMSRELREACAKNRDIKVKEMLDKENIKASSDSRFNKFADSPYEYLVRELKIAYNVVKIFEKKFKIWWDKFFNMIAARVVAYIQKKFVSWHKVKFIITKSSYSAFFLRSTRL